MGGVLVGAGKRREASLKRFARREPRRVIVRSLPGLARGRACTKLLDALGIAYTFEPARPEELPVTILLDDLTLKNPSRDTILKLIPPPPILREGYDTIIIGGGWTGVSAARVLAAHGLDVMLIEERTLLHRTTASFELIERFRESLTRDGIVFTEGSRVKRLKPVGRLWEASTDGAVYRARSVLLSIGGFQPGEGIPGSRLHGALWHIPPINRVQGTSCGVFLTTPEAYSRVLPLLDACERAFIMDSEDARHALPPALQAWLDERGIRVYPFARVHMLLGDEELEAIRFTSNEKAYQREARVFINAHPLVYDTHWLKPLGVLDEEGRIVHEDGRVADRVFVAGKAASRFALNEEARKADGMRAALRIVERVKREFGDIP